MRQLAIYLFAVVLCTTAWADGLQRLTPHTRAAMGQLSQDEMVQAFVTHDNFRCLRGLQVNMRYEDIALVSIPVRQLRQVASRPGVRQVALANNIHHQTDSSRSETEVDQIQQGLGLEMPYDGAGVVLGVIDTGIDFNHLAFRDAEGRPRIERVYRPTFEGGRTVVIDGDTLPGSQFVTIDEILSLTTDDANMTHGTHTMGIAAGTRVGKYGGMAPAARLVAVAIPNDSLTTARLILGARYIADYAKQLGLPCVINISMGDHQGAHDGTSPAARGFDAVAREYGAVIVLSAGNEGSRPLHIHKDFGSGASSQANWVGTVMRTKAGKAEAEVDAWGKDGTPFALELQLYDTREGYTRFTIPPITADTVIHLDDDPVMSQYATGTIRVHGGVDQVNGRYNIYTVFDTRMTNNRDFWVHIYRCDTVASIDAWNVDSRSQFEQMGRYDWVAGDSRYSISDIATGFDIVSVANYSARNYYETINGTISTTNVGWGNISPPSSYGTVPDGRSLPLVAAPGVAVISAVSSYALPSNLSFMQVDDSGRPYHWGSMSGTSMSAPCVAGIIALWMQACPTLTPSQVQDIISQTSVTDEFTALSPERWGAGKINAMNGIKMALAMRPSQLLGDVNGDGHVDVADVNLVINAMLGKPIVATSSPDANGDGHVDVADVNIIINLMLGKQ